MIESIGINNLHPVFGRGLRGETLAAARNRRFVNDLVAAGVRVVIDLRTADHNDKLMKGCEALGLAYHHFPIDSHVQADEEVAQSLPEMFDLLDRGDFYISCQQGKHRTDIALALYYFFHNDAEIPIMHGHRKDGVFRCDDILRRVNSMRPYFALVSDKIFSERREKFLEFNRMFEDELTRKYGQDNLADQLSRIAKAPSLPYAVLNRRKGQLLEDASKGECWFSSKSLYVDVFSNFYLCPIVLDGVAYPSAEHAYQAHKFPVGSEARVKLMAQETGSDVKSLASYLSSEMRSDWNEEKKVSVMRSILHAKYSQHPEFADIYRRVRYLELIHESRSDLFWGRKRNGEGKNMLGRLTVQIYEEILEHASFDQGGRI